MGWKTLKYSQNWYNFIENCYWVLLKQQVNHFVKLYLITYSIELINLKIKHFLETVESSTLDTVCYSAHTSTFHNYVCDLIGFLGTDGTEVVSSCRTNISIILHVTDTLYGSHHPSLTLLHFNIHPLNVKLILHRVAGSIGSIPADSEYTR